MTDITDTQLASTTVPQGASLVGYRANATGAMARTELDKRQETGVITPEDFGAVGDVFFADGSVNPSPTDDSAAITAAFAALGPRTRMVLSRVYAFKNPIVAPLVDGVTIEGKNPFLCGFYYIGTSTTSDLITIGNGSREMVGWNLRKFYVDSRTKMTAGAGIRVRIGINVYLDDLAVAGNYAERHFNYFYNYNRNLWDGIFMDGWLYCRVRGCDLSTNHVGLKIAGTSNGSYGAQCYIGGGNSRVGGCLINILVGGDAGGVILDDMDVIGGAQNNIVIDNSVTGNRNGAIFFGQKLTVDSVQSTGQDGILLNDSASTGVNYPVLFSNCWVATGPRYGWNIQNFGNGDFGGIYLNGGSCSNFQQAGMNIQTSVPPIYIDGVLFNGNAAVAINGTGTAQKNVKIRNPLFSHNGSDMSGNFEGNIDTWTPSSIFPYAGSFGGNPTVNFAEYQEYGQVGANRLIHFTVQVKLPALGSASGGVNIRLPYLTRSNRNYSAVWHNVSNGQTGGAIVTNSGGFAIVAFPQALFTGDIVEVSGSYVAA